MRLPRAVVRGPRGNGCPRSAPCARSLALSDSATHTRISAATVAHSGRRLPYRVSRLSKRNHARNAHITLTQAARSAPRARSLSQTPRTLGLCALVRPCGSMRMAGISQMHSNVCCAGSMGNVKHCPHNRSHPRNHWPVLLSSPHGRADRCSRPRPSPSFPHIKEPGAARALGGSPSARRRGAAAPLLWVAGVLHQRRFRRWTPQSPSWWWCPSSCAPQGPWRPPRSPSDPRRGSRRAA